MFYLCLSFFSLSRLCTWLYRLITFVLWCISLRFSFFSFPNYFSFIGVWSNCAYLFLFLYFVCRVSIEQIACKCDRLIDSRSTSNFFMWTISWWSLLCINYFIYNTKFQAGIIDRIFHFFHSKSAFSTSCKLRLSVIAGIFYLRPCLRCSSKSETYLWNLENCIQKLWSAKIRTMDLPLTMRTFFLLTTATPFISFIFHLATNILEQKDNHIPLFVAVI